MHEHLNSSRKTKLSLKYSSIFLFGIEKIKLLLKQQKYFWDLHYSLSDFELKIKIKFIFDCF